MKYLLCKHQNNTSSWERQWDDRSKILIHNHFSSSSSSSFLPLYTFPASMHLWVYKEHLSGGRCGYFFGNCVLITECCDNVSLFIVVYICWAQHSPRSSSSSPPFQQSPGSSFPVRCNLVRRWCLVVDCNERGSLWMCRIRGGILCWASTSSQDVGAVLCWCSTQHRMQRKRKYTVLSCVVHDCGTFNFRNWKDYVAGFGDEHWLGLKKIYWLTKTILRVDLGAYTGG